MPTAGRLDVSLSNLILAAIVKSPTSCVELPEMFSDIGGGIVCEFIAR
jgi:hypothetical protein